MADHSPTPWFADDRDVFTQYGVACKRPVIAENAANWKANSAFIVTAVNSHDALVEALEGLVEAVRRDCDVRDKGISGYTYARLTDAKNALASIKDD